jgi:hypothetical protein
MTPLDRLLARLIRLNAAVLLLAAVPVFFPTDLMAAMHARLGLGTFPRDRLTEYLTRSAAACYALHGAVVWMLARDVVRYRDLIAGVYRLHLVFAAAVCGIDLWAGMPGWWTLSEGGTIAVVALAIGEVNRRAKRASCTPTPG